MKRKIRPERQFWWWWGWWWWWWRWRSPTLLVLSRDGIRVTAYDRSKTW